MKNFDSKRLMDKIGMISNVDFLKIKEKTSALIKQQRVIYLLHPPKADDDPKEFVNKF